MFSVEFHFSHPHKINIKFADLKSLRMSFGFKMASKIIIILNTMPALQTSQLENQIWNKHLAEYQIITICSRYLPIYFINTFLHINEFTTKICNSVLNDTVDIRKKCKNIHCFFYALMIVFALPGIVKTIVFCSNVCTV